jgi:hypothetical protein
VTQSGATISAAAAVAAAAAAVAAAAAAAIGQFAAFQYVKRKDKQSAKRENCKLHSRKL